MKELAEKYAQFKVFRISRWDKNRKSEQVREIQRKIYNKYNEMYQHKKSFWSSVFLDFSQQMIFDSLIRERALAESEGIPSETIEGMLEWIQQGEPTH